ncbi:VPS9 domain-containing protein [Mycena sanguinolenta]|uniref:VPS9 domain-containing protein n=1 Tax=Mycena sanguinolenta TaxID=230812 RepID=A0A8H6YW90_9AGAR|nr:VPS9 domain-containing protein [Mycena sanguinolenta]
MGSNRDNLFPAVSIGRRQGHNTSAELLTAHPLLSPTPSTPNSPDHTQRSHSPSGNGPRYVPYTPRQRSAPSAATTTGMTTHPSVATPLHQGQGGATSKLQLMNLKAAAQNVGLDTGSVGWAILEKLVDSEGGEWTEIWSALCVGKATLLLPLEAIANNEKITAQFVKDHVILCDGPSRKNAHIITLSGLRGTLDGNTLTFRSTLHPSSKLFTDLLSPATRSSVLATLAPLPHLPTATSYPMFGVPSYTASLPLRPRTPPLPPRPRGPQPQSGSLPSRLSNPFASLFGSHSNSNSGRNTPQTQQASPPASIYDYDVHTGSEQQPLDIPAFTLARRIVRRDVARAIDKTMRGELHALCTVGGAPPWVAERVDTFVAPWYPFRRVKRSSEKGSVGSSNGIGDYVVGDPLGGMLPEEIGEMVQGFYVKLEEDLRSGGSGRRKASEASHHDGEDEKEKEEKEALVGEASTRVSLSQNWVFMDIIPRLFVPVSSDDSSHDQALSSRVAALNMLDLNLEHLGVDVPPEATEGLEHVVKACGQILSTLELHQCPAEKAAVMVQAHREVVDAPSIVVSRTSQVADDKDSGIKREPQPPVPLTPPSSVSTSESDATTPTANSNAPVANEALSERPELVPLPPSYSGETATPETDTSAVGTPASDPPHPMTPTPVSSDVLLPLVIFAVVKSNPPRMVSHLLFTQRFRVTPSGIAHGEEAFSLVNLMAVAEFLENVDLEALGLGNGGISTADLTPIPLARSAGSSPKTPTPGMIPGMSFVEDGTGLLRRQVDTLAGGAGRVITGVTGVVDSSFGMLRQFLPGTTPPPMTPALDSTQGAAPWNFPHVARPGFGLLRRETGFSIGGISIGGRSAADEKEKELREVSRPGSLRGEEEDEDEGVDEEEESGEEDEEDEKEGGGHDARSIRSFESMMSSKGRKLKPKRKSLSDRLAHVSGLAGFKASFARFSGSPPPPRRESLLAGTNRFDTPVSSRPSSPAMIGGGLRLPPPNPRFLDCAADDLRLAEVAELLREYRRLVEGVRAVGGFIGDD